MRDLAIAVVHGFYAQPGGEDAVVESEVELLRAKGNVVHLVSRRNGGKSARRSLIESTGGLWNSRICAELDRLHGSTPLDILHVHNSWPLVTPSVFWWARKRGVKTVQTLHNFRLSCLNAIYLRDGRICEDCVGRVPWRGIINKCYRSSMLSSAALFSTLMFHRSLETYSRNVDAFIALNEFCKDKFVEGGLPQEKIYLKPNFLHADVAPESDLSREGFLFVGRLSEEKGIRMLAEVAKQNPAIQFKVVGDGPLRDHLRLKNVDLVGRVSQDVVVEYMRKAKALLVPSIWYENFPRTIVESFSCALPVICSRVGALEYIVSDGYSGLLVSPTEATEWTAALHTISDEGESNQLGRNARAEYEAKYSADVNFKQLIEIYGSILAE